MISVLTPGVDSAFAATEPAAVALWPAVITSRRELPVIALPPARRLPFTDATVLV